jgi:starch synthase (maltosyl-transferring)
MSVSDCKRVVESLSKRVATSPRRPWPDRPVPIALTITDLDVGGAERALVALARGIDRRKWAPTVIGLEPEGALASVLRDAGVAATCLGCSSRRPWQVVARLASALRQTGAELAQSFMFHANLATRLAAPLAGVPWVVGGLRVAERQKRWHLLLDRGTIGLSTGSVCVSRGVFEFSRAVGALPAERLTFIPNGVDVDLYDGVRPFPLGLPEGSQVALFVGRLHVQKGVADLLEAAVIVTSTRPDWHLVIVGRGPLEQALRVRADAIPELAGRVHWLGHREDVPSLMKAADVLVLPSHWEGMPNVVLEAMAAGLAVVATDVEGTVDLVTPSETGWLVPAGSPRRLAEALLEAARDPARTRGFGEGGRAKVEAQFSPSAVVAAYDALWSAVLGYERDDSALPPLSPG